MENLAHSLTGVLLARLGLRSWVPYGTVSLVVAANLPDADTISGLGGAFYYLDLHRGVTHSIAGTLLLALLLAAGLWQLRPRGWSTQRAGPGKCLAGIVLALLSHPLLDYTNAYGLRPFLPFSDYRTFGDLVFIVDPYLWIILGSGVFLTASRSRRSLPFWWVGMILILTLSSLFAWSDWAGRWLLLVFFLTACLMVRLKKQRPVWSATTAAVALAGALVYFAFLWECRQLALARVQAEISEEFPILADERIWILPRPANPFSWEVLLLDNSTVQHARASIWRPFQNQFTHYSRNLSDPAVVSALRTCPGEVFDRFGRFKFFQITTETDGTLVVTGRDARFTRIGRTGFGTVRIPMKSDLSDTLLTTPCPRWNRAQDSFSLRVRAGTTSNRSPTIP